jgi:hypothetical protein
MVAKFWLDPMALVVDAKNIVQRPGRKFPRLSVTIEIPVALLLF